MIRVVGSELKGMACPYVGADEQFQLSGEEHGWIGGGAGTETTLGAP